MIELFSSDTPNGKKISIMLEEIGFEYKVVSADNGQIGGSESHEFHVIAENGEDELIFSDS